MDQPSQSKLNSTSNMVKPLKIIIENSSNPNQTQNRPINQQNKTNQFSFEKTSDYPENKSKSKLTNPDSSNSNFDRKFQILNKNALKIALKDESEIFNKLVNNGITGIAELKFCSDYELLDISTLLGFSNVEIHKLVRAIRLS